MRRSNKGYIAGSLITNSHVMSMFRRLTNTLRRRFEHHYSPNSISYEEALQWFERRKDSYEELIIAVAPLVDPQGTMFDVGANIGYFSLLLMEEIHFSGNAYLFEPVPNLANLCKSTFKDKPYKTQVFDFALSDQDGEFEMFTAGDGNIGWNTFISQNTAPDMQNVTVKSKRFDSAGIEVIPSFIKIDVEGAEYKVLQGMMKSLNAWKPLPVILCEVAWGQNHPHWKEELAVFDELGKLGYDFCDLKKGKIEIAELKKTTDVILMPRSKSS